MHLSLEREHFLNRTIIVAPVLHTLRTTVVEWSHSALGLIYPPACAACGGELSAYLDAPPSQRRLCEACIEQLRCRTSHACLTCGAPVGPYLQGWTCRHCRQDQFAFDRVVALGVYESALRAACRRTKDGSGGPLAAGLAELLYEAHEATLSGAELDLIVPIPHHWWERLTQPHLPPVTLGGVLSRRLSIPMVPHILAKRRRTPAQSSLSPLQRRRNLRGAFSVSGGLRLDGLSVLLTDDILTTGTTADRAARILKKAGVKRVLVAVLARGIGQASFV